MPVTYVHICQGGQKLLEGRAPAFPKSACRRHVCYPRRREKPRHQDSGLAVSCGRASRILLSDSQAGQGIYEFLKFYE